jgi:hypothetical protein
MRSYALVVAGVTLAGTAAAEPVNPYPEERVSRLRALTAGFSIGMAQSKADAPSDANNTLGLWGRYRFATRVSAQLEFMRISTDERNANLRSGTVSLVVDLANKGRYGLMPYLIAGIGIDRSADELGSNYTGHHLEGGLGLELRLRNGLTAGIDARLGGRSIGPNEEDVIEPPTGGDVIFYVPSRLTDGEYRQIRATLGVRF